MATIRVLRTAKTTLSRTFYLDEVATDASGSVAVAITREDGTAVQSGNATGPVSDVYSFVFQGSDVLDRLIVTWSGTFGGDAIVLDQDVIEVVGGFYFGLSEARSIDSVFGPPNGSTRYPTADVIDVRTETENEAERICGQAFVPRFERETLSGRPHDRHLRLHWPNLRKVRAVTVNGTAFTSDQLTALGPDPLGILRPARSFWWFWDDRNYGSWWPYGQGNIVVEYEHGLDRAPVEVVRAAKLRWKSLMFERKSRSPLPDRSERLQTSEVGTVTLATPTQWTTGIPSVDAVYARYSGARPGFG